MPNADCVICKSYKNLMNMFANYPKAVSAYKKGLEEHKSKEHEEEF